MANDLPVKMRTNQVNPNMVGNSTILENSVWPSLTNSDGTVEVTTRPVGISCLHSLPHQQGVSCRGASSGSVEAGVLGRRGFVLECAAAQVCRETGGRVSTNVMVRDLDVAEFNLRDTRRLEVVADGLSIFGGAQLTIDTTLAASRDVISLTATRQRKERTHPELSGEGGARLVVLAAQVGGRWSDETAQFLRALSKSKAASAPALLKGRTQAAWFRRWGSIMGCSAARAFAVSLLEQRSAPGTGGDPPSEQEVLRTVASSEEHCHWAFDSAPVSRVFVEFVVANFCFFVVWFFFQQSRFHSDIKKKCNSTTDRGRF